MKTAFSLLLAAVSVAIPAAAQVKITPGPEKIAVEINGQPFTDFYVAGPEVAKPYLHPLRAASGTYVTRMWPMAEVAEEAGQRRDHPHQRGLWFAHARVNGLDFWNIAPSNQPPYNRPDRGKIVLKKLGDVKSGKDKGTVAATFEWTNRDGQVLLTESRLTTFYSDPNLRIVDFDITLTAAQKVDFEDEKDGVLGVRLRPILQEDKGAGRLTNAEGLVTEKQLWGKASKWCDYSGDVNGEKVGLTILDHPQNPSSPVRWHARGYGLLAANPFGFATFTNPKDKAAHRTTTLEQGKSMRFRYRMIIHPGDAASTGIAALWDKYAAGK
jgi:hypothetical protein